MTIIISSQENAYLYNTGYHTSSFFPRQLLFFFPLNTSRQIFDSCNLEPAFVFPVGKVRKGGGINDKWMLESNLSPGVGEEGRIISNFKIERKGAAEQLQTVDVWAESKGVEEV